MNKSIFLSNIHYAYGRTDGTYAWPNSLEGDLLKQAMKELLVLRQERDEARQRTNSILVEIDCRIEHGADSNGHLEAIRSLFKENTNE